MSSSTVSKTKTHGKTITLAVLECVIIISFFVLFSSSIDFDSFPALVPFLLVVYPLGISICTGMMVASIAETKHMVGWSWGVLALGMTLIFMAMMVIFPSMWSGMAIIIAPLFSTILLLLFMNSGEKDN